MRTIGHLLGSVIGALLRLIGWIIRLPFRAVGRLLVAAIAFGRAVGALPIRFTRRTFRLVGVRGIVFGLLGLVAGLLLAPVTGPELRKKLAGLLGAGPVSDAELIEKVAFELSHAPRTWHLEPQPQVEVVAGRVILTGAARDDDASDEFRRVAAAIPGVVGVDNQLVVAG